MKKWIKFDYDKFLALPASAELLACPNHIVPKNPSPTTGLWVRMVDVCLPGDFFILGVATRPMYTGDVSFIRFSRNGEVALTAGRPFSEHSQVWMKVEVKEPTRYWVASYPIKDKGPDEITLRRVTRTLYPSYDACWKEVRKWDNADQIQIHEVVVEE